MYLMLILITGFILLRVGAVAAWPNSAGWGDWPGGGTGLLPLLLLMLLILLLMGRI